MTTIDQARAFRTVDIILRVPLAPRVKQYATHR